MLGDFEGKRINENELNVSKARINRTSNSRISPTPDYVMRSLLELAFIYLQS